MTSFSFNFFPRQLHPHPCRWYQATNEHNSGSSYEFSISIPRRWDLLCKGSWKFEAKSMLLPRSEKLRKKFLPQFSRHVTLHRILLCTGAKRSAIDKKKLKSAYVDLFDYTRKSCIKLLYSQQIWEKISGGESWKIYKLESKCITRNSCACWRVAKKTYKKETKFMAFGRDSVDHRDKLERPHFEIVRWISDITRPTTVTLFSFAAS